MWLPDPARVRLLAVSGAGDQADHPFASGCTRGGGTGQVIFTPRTRVGSCVARG